MHFSNIAHQKNKYKRSVSQ